MTCFLMENPRAVLIHIPKTGGTAMRWLWPDPPVQRCYGYIPDTWMDAEKIAVVRNPEARFLSGVRMFKYGTTGVNGAVESPRMPDLDVDRALDIVENPSVGFDRTQRTERENLKHHLLPQTHPFHCLHLADHVLRQETLAEDVAALGLDGLRPLTRQREAVAASDLLQLTNQQRTRLQRVFAQDYDLLGYDQTGAVSNPVTLPPAPERAIWPLWPAYFSDQTVLAKMAQDALPADGVDLKPFVDETIAGIPKSTWPGRKGNLTEHFRNLQPEFVGSSRIAHLAACCIVVIRRTQGAGPGLLLFNRIMSEHGDVVLADMNSRWLCSVADTLADHGQHPAQQALGLCGSLLAAAVKLAETERLIYAVPRPWPPNARLGEDGVMYDGVISFWGENGDMIDNLLDRVAKAEDLDPIGGQLILEMTSRILRFDTVFRRMAELSGRPDVPQISDEIRARLTRIANNRL